MAESHRALRGVLLAAGVVLVIALLGTIGAARLRANHLLRGLPAHLGADIRQETDGFTYSQSVKGRTVFTVHAGKEIQRGDGTVTLHDVGILLYGQRPGEVDRIHGGEFVYDQAHGILRADGEVFLDLLGSGASAAADAGPSGGDPARVLHVRTSALVFREKERTAATDAPLEFTAGALHGRAIGATYDGEAGTLVLRSAVALEGSVSGSARSLHADRAEMHHADNTVLLERARYGVAVRGGDDVIGADRAVIKGSPGGRPLGIEAQGHVLGRTPSGASVESERGKVTFTDAGLPRELFLDGGVRLREPAQALGRIASPNRAGSADSARLVFDAGGHPANATLEGAVDLREVLPGDAGERRLNAARADLTFAPGAHGPVMLRQAVALGTGTAVARLRLAGKAANGGAENTEVAGDTVEARFAAEAAGRDARLSGLTAQGHAGLERTSGRAGVDLTTEKSTADTLTIELADGPQSAPTLHRATETGAVVIVREAPAKGTGQGPVVEHGRAHTAVYEPASAVGAASGAGTLTLTGEAEVVEGANTVAAERIALDRGSGDASAEGAVHLAFASAGGGRSDKPDKPGEPREPIHALGARAVSHHATGVTELFGADGGRARMWGSGAQVEAPMLVFDAGQEAGQAAAASQSTRHVRPTGRLLAHGAPGDDDAVRAVLPPGGLSTPGTGVVARAATVVRSGEMVFTEAHDLDPDTIVFRRHVRVASGESSLHADAATVTLIPENAGGGARQIRELVTDGAVALDQPGRRARGTKLVYTAADASYLLTGAPGAPPRLDDADRGTVTGSAIRFSSADDRAVVSGGPETGGRVHTETHAGGRP